MGTEKGKDIWDKITAASALIASVFIPIVLAVIGNSYSSAIKQSENSVKYTELAISILKEKPIDETQHIRDWAIEVVNQYSGVPMSAKVKEQLLRSRLVRSDMRDSDFTESMLQQSNFNSALLDGSSFENASLRGVDLRGADLRGADLSGADLSGAIIDSKTKLPSK